ncbi:hydroxymethylglutaryl-CoA lyase [Sediminibacterium soli]|uniref:hydroxymethylglutaryl-CoA lyase n=1 Tax=Sediminibacterium soli TaxID=2698829 RepID=UPI00137A5BE9|nr:hydroxymethylglutaryl-CoA lyase [Sediminibacterium soli]NCI45850.1 hydroxymethylglutaryl-CoA lyase [Sediminibacterium soli]
MPAATSSIQNRLPALVECPRDAMQGWPHPIPTEKKIRYLHALLQVGFDTLDFGSFVSPKAIPQMADTKEVLAKLDLTGSATRLLAIVANTRGAEEAAAFDAIRFLGFPFSLSPTFQLRNTNSTMEESLLRLDKIQEICTKRNKELVVYLSMGFGNPYGDPYDADTLLYWAGQMVKRQVRIISLADTVGLATASQVQSALAALLPQYPGTEFGVHLHASPANWKAKFEAAWQTGCRRFDGALKGIGGCPMAQDELVGNMNTEWMIAYFAENGIDTGIRQQALQKSLLLASEIFM